MGNGGIHPKLNLRAQGKIRVGIGIPKNHDGMESPVLLQIRALHQKARENLRSVRRKIAVVGGKGGVGKSSVTANLAAVLAMDGFRVGVLDADVQGASQAEMLGVPETEPDRPIGTGFHEVRVASMGSFFERRKRLPGPHPLPLADAAWQSALDSGIVREFIVEADWGELDFLLVDTPPASWEILTALSGLVPDLEGALIVTQPSDAAQSVLERSLSVCEGLGVPVLGIIENMAKWECPHCGCGVPLFDQPERNAGRPDRNDFLATIPFDPRLGAASRTGKPFAALYPESPAGKALAGLAQSLVRLENETRSAFENL